MKICFTTKEKKGLASNIYDHFGSAPYFIIVDDATNDFLEIENGNLHHDHGKCSPLKALLGNKVDVVIVGGIGENAKLRLAHQGVLLYQAEKKTIAENLELFKNGKLTKMSDKDLCQSHDCGDHLHHDHHNHHHGHSIIKNKS
jgi:predicted Fe-Mo cluster-binding NifX family protein